MRTQCTKVKGKVHEVRESHSTSQDIRQAMKKTDPQAAARSAMTAENFRNWRKVLGLKQKDAADLLGLKKRMIQYYEKGNRDGKPVEIPKTVRLACYAISQGIMDFDGQAVELLPEELPEDEPERIEASPT